MYSTTSNLTVAYNVGAMGGVMYTMQVISGVVIAMSYVASEEYSFPTLDSAQRDASYGWCLRAIHSNMASAVFCSMYLHACRAWCYAVLSTVHHAV